MFSATLPKELRGVCKKFMQEVSTQTHILTRFNFQQTSRSGRSAFFPSFSKSFTHYIHTHLNPVSSVFFVWRYRKRTNHKSGIFESKPQSKEEEFVEDQDSSKISLFSRVLFLKMCAVMPFFLFLWATVSANEVCFFSHLLILKSIFYFSRNAPSK
jgi:hypothetical protein